MVIFRIDDGSCISVFPGKATTIAADNGSKTVAEKIQKLSTVSNLDTKYKNKIGESIKLRITDPLVSPYMKCIE